MNLSDIEQAIDGAYSQALAAPSIIPPQQIATNVYLHTETYESPEGSGFRVVATLSFPEYHFAISRVKNHGPDIYSERDWPSEGVEVAVKSHLSRCISAGENHVTDSGFNADRKVILLNKLLKVKETDMLPSCPKLTALYAWMEQVQAIAVSGRFSFPPPPYSFEEVIAE